MKKLLLLFFIVSWETGLYTLTAQPLRPPKNVSLKFGLYDKQGIMIKPYNTEYSITFLFDNVSDTIHDKVLHSQTEVEFSENMFKVLTMRNSEVTITITQKKSTMVIHTLVSIDSIVFNQGEYKIESFHGALFNQITTYNKAKILNFDINHFKINSSVKATSYYFSIEPNISRTENIDECIKYSKKIENFHGGSNWALNTCNNNYQSVFISDDYISQTRINKICSTDPNKIRVKIYPIEKNKLIKHEFYPGGKFLHTFSISTDFGENWIKILSIKDEWYVSIVYFPDLNKIGIVGNGFLLISDYYLTDWKYYYLKQSNNDTKENNYVGLVLRNENWYDNYFGHFRFSE